MRAHTDLYLTYRLRLICRVRFRAHAHHIPPPLPSGPPPTLWPAAARKLRCAARRQGGTGRAWTVSIAVPGSIIDNTQNLEFATFVAGQIARTAAIFNVDEACSLPSLLRWFY